eukprot:318891-Hanusia_phi.AAC.4
MACPARTAPWVLLNPPLKDLARPVVRVFHVSRRQALRAPVLAVETMSAARGICHQKLEKLEMSGTHGKLLPPSSSLPASSFPASLPASLFPFLPACLPLSLPASLPLACLSARLPL